MTDRAVPNCPPAPSRGLFGDIRHFLLRRPAEPTHVEIADEQTREHYGRRIALHIGRPVDDYAVLNIHRIGIDATVDRIFEAVRGGEALANCWPNHLARVRRNEANAARSQVSLFGWRFWPLFRLTEIEMDEFDANARKILFRCHSGYPIGILAMLGRPSIRELGESGASQFFFVVSFNFYGRKRWWGARWMHGIWEAVHNRATGNILNRLRMVCEAAPREARVT